jgi:hypothetical protein
MVECSPRRYWHSIHVVQLASHGKRKAICVLVSQHKLVENFTEATAAATAAAAAAAGSLGGVVCKKE